ncbi:metal-dependent hydrolase [Undibacter mobilis]|uniref:Metal-dependent hydrolase n=1 Tax=Undibacter mobilis TaxID=2292256 RepID=A0A371BBL8_9BRAD|nr:metal-dependent hydrolase [Undibacter mobilis]RDV04803.1 metal-dependent hydrolase [Undibacter mobilis]
MDSLSQAALGAAIGVAVMGRRTKPWKAALVGALAGTLPDLDSFYDHGDPISNMVFHRAKSHALFWQTLASLPIAALTTAALHDWRHFKPWWLTIWLALVTHALLDWTTVYGTQLGLPFTDTPFGLGSMFIIDPAYTVPLLIGIGVALSLRNTRGWRWNVAGLVISTAYLGWSALAQHHTTNVAEENLRAQGHQVERLLVTPAPLTTVLWRIVAITPQGYLEGYYSLLDRDRTIAFDNFPRGTDLYAQLRGNPYVETIARFSRGFFKMSERDGRAVITDLRMGMEPRYTFNFDVALRQSPTFAPLVPPTRHSDRLDAQSGLPWLWRRALGEKLPPPR